MPNKTKNPDQPDKDTQTQREETQDDRMPQRRDGGMREDQEPIEQGDTQKVEREPDSRKDEEADEEEELEDEEDPGLIE